MNPKLIITLVLFLQLTLGQTMCPTGEVSVKLRKKSTNYASEESFKIGNGGTVYTSPSLSNNEIRELDICLAASVNNQYSLELIDSYGDSWTNGAWLEIKGVYDNIFFKNYLTGKRTETFVLSLYYGVMQTQSWRLTASAPTGWTAYGFSDSSWQQITLQVTATTATGTQYLRYTFTGLTGMASFETRFRYRFGIVAYVNAVEIYRDNMPAGAPSSSTVATGSYPTLGYRGVLRSAVLMVAQSILAVEIHFVDANSQNLVDFDAFLALNAPSVVDRQCSIVPTSVILTTPSSVTTVSNVFDFSFTSYMYLTMPTTPVVINYNFDSSVRPVVNALNIWSYTYHTSQAKAFSFGGSHEDSVSAVFNPIIDTKRQIYETQKFKYFYGHFNLDHFKYYRMTITQSVSSTLYLSEVMPMVCNIPTPTTLIFEPVAYSSYYNYQPVDIAPSISGYSGCSVQPALPAGLILNAATCSVTGTSTVETPSSSYVITTTSPIVVSGSFSLATPQCTGTMISFKRVYSSSATSEGFKVIDPSSENVLLSVAANSGQENNVEEFHMVCVVVPRIEVKFDDTTISWSSGSFLYVNVMLDTVNILTLGRIRKDNNLGLPLSTFFNTQLPISSRQQWYYKMGEVPASWTSSATDGFTLAETGTIPASTNKIQLYKKIFTIPSLTNVAGFILSLKYKYGCVVFINDVEVYRMGVDGAVSTAATATNVYNDVIYRTITLPTKTMKIGDVESVTYLQTNSNTIAIALIALSDSQTASVFDCVLSLMGENAVNRAYDMTVTQIGSSGLAGAFDDYFSTYYSGSACADNTGTIIFNDDRREWISSVIVQTYYSSITDTPSAFIIEARNPEDEAWTPMKNAIGLQWSIVGQLRRFWLINNKPYNQWRIRNAGSGKPTSCSWKMNRVHLQSNSMTQDIPALTFESSMAFVNIEMSEVYPSSDMFDDFTITPSLPSGIMIDAYSGMIYGTGTGAVASTNYNIQARVATGLSVSCSFSFGIEVCYGGKALMTMKVRIDSYTSEVSYKLFSGRGTTGGVVATSGYFPTANTIYYLDRCLADGIYTFMAQDSYGDGWYAPAGWSLSLDSGELLYDMNMMPNGGKPTQVSNVFSSVIPFQVEHTSDWKVYSKSESVASDWKTLSFSETGWLSMKAANIGVSQATTIYIRKTFSVPNLDDYQVLNVRMKFTGGAVVYINGNIVARFNLDRVFDETTSGGPARESSSFAKFHVILPTAGVVVGNNVMAIELHRASSVSSTDPIIFDATGVFGVQDCSPVLDSYISVTSSTTIGSTVPASAFDMSSLDNCKLENKVDAHLTWEVENLLGSRFNNYGIMGDSVSSLSFSLNARDQDNEEWLEIGSESVQTVTVRKQASFDAPVGLIGFRQHSWKQIVAASISFAIYNFFSNYCKTSGAVCQGLDQYPSVTEGQISPAACAVGYRGYSFRTCTGGVLGPIDNTKCLYRIPERLSYSLSRFEFVREISVRTNPPTYDYIVTKFFMDEGKTLPEGLFIDPETGVIHGTPIVEMDTHQVFTIRAENPSGSTYVEINIIVRLGSCKADGVFPKTVVGQIAVHECSSQGSYIGSQKRACKLGAIDGEWQKASGFCMSIATIVILVVVVIIIVIAIIFVLLRITAKTKSVGGVKGKKSVKTSGKSASSAKKSASNKAVKV